MNIRSFSGQKFQSLKYTVDKEGKKVANMEINDFCVSVSVSYTLAWLSLICTA